MTSAVMCSLMHSNAAAKYAIDFCSSASHILR